MNWDQIADDMRAIRAENEVSLAIRRGASMLTAQPMRIEYAGSRGFRLQSDAARAAQQAVFILGEPDMDIAVGDRLTYTNILLQVVFIQPNRLACTIAEAIAVE
ncbi:MAG TPA: hypothetical protein VI753_16060 [Anaerolineales bacterium]|nr:hypothetical protein [Anaerolineales bacterium]